MKYQGKPVPLKGLVIIPVPYWLIRILDEKKMPLSSLSSISTLRRILTELDLKNYLSCICERSQLTQFEPFKAHALTMALLATADSLCHPPMLATYEAPHLAEPLSEGTVQSLIVPADRQGTVQPDSLLDPILFPIDDDDFTSNPDEGVLIMGLTFHEISHDDSEDYLEVERASICINLLSKYYGAKALITTPLAAHWIGGTLLTENAATV